jgi:hypothetical protein
MAKRNLTVWHNCQGTEGNYSWAVVENMVCVRAANRQKCTQIGGHPPDLLARILARELGALNRCADCS